jgi:hypothetical protein
MEPAPGGPAAHRVGCHATCPFALAPRASALGVVLLNTPSARSGTLGGSGAWRFYGGLKECVAVRHGTDGQSIADQRLVHIARSS